jgi:E3 ubiquitin-protein ligase MYCBP2
MFVSRSHVFSNISKILSRSEEEQDDISMSMHESHQSTYSQVSHDFFQSFMNDTFSTA